MAVTYSKADVKNYLSSLGHGDFVNPVIKFIKNFEKVTAGDGIAYTFGGLSLEEEEIQESVSEYYGEFEFKKGGYDMSISFVFKVFENGTVMFSHTIKGLDSQGNLI